jgi:G3E family GTPase
VEKAIRTLNPIAPIRRAQRSNVPLDTILGRHAFDLTRVTELQPDFLNPPHGEAGHVHDEHCDHDHDHHDHDHDHGHGHIHDHVAESGISSISLTATKPIDANRVTAWLNNLLQVKGPDILRAKGILDVKGEDRRLVFQAVHMILEGDFQGPWKDTDKRYSRLVFIGRNLDEAALKAGFESCIAA